MTVFIDHSVYAAVDMDRGVANLRANRFADAVLDFNIVLQFAPNDPYAHWNKATALLSLGDYKNGFVEHDWGWRLFNWRGFGPVRNDIDRLRTLPTWRGMPDQRVLLYHELGYGDAIMAFRYLPVLKQKCKAITLVIDEALASLAGQFGIDHVETRVPLDLSPFDWRLPLFGSMLVLGETVDTIPRDPYIKAEWKREGGNLGVAWSGRTQQTFTAASFLREVDCEGYKLHSLQHAEAVPLGMVPLQAKDFADTVKVIERMDHVLTVDTAVAHLAGAMGHPSTHLIIPFLSDWRWWRADAWYPTLKVYRQSQAGRWPFEEVRSALHK